MRHWTTIWDIAFHVPQGIFGTYPTVVYRWDDTYETFPMGIVLNSHRSESSRYLPRGYLLVQSHESVFDISIND
jgi:hypothetical protein